MRNTIAKRLTLSKVTCSKNDLQCTCIQNFFIHLKTQYYSLLMVVTVPFFLMEKTKTFTTCVYHIVPFYCPCPKNLILPPSSFFQKKKKSFIFRRMLTFILIMKTIFYTIKSEIVISNITKQILTSQNCSKLVTYYY